MIEASTLRFLAELKENNHKQWFDDNRSRYEAARKNFLELIETLIAGIATFDPTVAGLEAKKCVFRINRDVRFSKDKAPYKTNFGASIDPGGRHIPSAGYYLHLEPGTCFIAGGSYHPPAPVLKSIREAIDYEPEAFLSIFEGAEFKRLFGGLREVGVLKTTPKGYAADHPAIEYLKHKSIIAVHDYNGDQSMKPDFVPYALNGFKTLMPLIDFLNKAIKG